jgi:hypothetical protein
MQITGLSFVRRVPPVLSKLIVEKRTIENGREGNLFLPHAP